MKRSGGAGQPPPTPQPTSDTCPQVQNNTHTKVPKTEAGCWHGLFRDVWLRGGPELYFSENWPLPVTVWGCFCLFWSGFRQTALHPYPKDRVRFFFGWGGGVEGPTPILGVESSKNYVSEKVGTVGELYKDKILKKKWVGCHC